MNAEVSSVDPTEDHSIKVNAAAQGKEEPAVFDLVVLITQPQISKDARDLTKSLGLSLSYADFLSAEGTGLISTEKPEISLTAQK